MSGPAPALELRHVSKRFGGVLANDDVSFAAAAGAIHALVGENGAGKTTAMRIAFGLLAPDRGEVAVDGAPRRFAGPQDAIRLGIGMVHQHFTLVDAMTVTENVVLGAEPGRRWALDLAGASAGVAELAREAELRIDPAARAGELPVAARQRVELLKALYRQARVLILDEPTAVLAPPEVVALFAVLRRLRRQGRTVVLITHRLSEVLAIADEVTVLRDGRVVAARPAHGLAAAELARLIVGREAPPRTAKHPARPGAPVLSVRGLTIAAPGGAGGVGGDGGRPRLDGVSFDVRAGEIFGIAGLLGAGRSEILQTLFGAADGRRGGAIFLDGRPLDIDSPVDAKRAGLSLVTEDRKFDGLVLGAGIDLNLALPSYERLSRTGVVPVAAELELVLAAMQRLGVRARDHRQVAGTLSGGNQQKVVMGKWLATEPRVLLLDEPTRGIDVGAKAEIYELLAQLAQRGLAIVIVSSEMPELLSLSDRILVMREGRPTALLERAEFSPERVMEYASPGGDVQEGFAEAAA
jgi:ribose transport system ATP-binding protein